MLITAATLRKYLKLDGVRFPKLLERAGVQKAKELTEPDCKKVMALFYMIRGEGILRRNGRASNLDKGSPDFDKHHSSARRLKKQEEAAVSVDVEDELATTATAEYPFAWGKAR